jgi:hypothetical protein
LIVSVAAPQLLPAPIHFRGVAEGFNSPINRKELRRHAAPAAIAASLHEQL